MLVLGELLPGPRVSGNPALQTNKRISFSSSVWCRLILTVTSGADWLACPPFASFEAACRQKQSAGTKKHYLSWTRFWFFVFMRTEKYIGTIIWWYFMHESCSMWLSPHTCLRNSSACLSLPRLLVSSARAGASNSAVLTALSTWRRVSGLKSARFMMEWLDDGAFLFRVAATSE